MCVCVRVVSARVCVCACVTSGVKKARQRYNEPSLKYPEKKFPKWVSDESSFRWRSLTESGAQVLASFDVKTSPVQAPELQRQAQDSPGKIPRWKLASSV